MAIDPTQPPFDPQRFSAPQLAPPALPVTPSSLRPGTTRSRPQPGTAQQHGGIHPLSPITHRTQRFQPLPAPLGEPPYHIDLSTLVEGINEQSTQNGQLVFHVVGDTGGIQNPDYQRAVAAAMKGDLNKAGRERPAFFYHLGDVVYYNGEIVRYYDQFYERSSPNHEDDPYLQTALHHHDRNYGWYRR